MDPNPEPKVGQHRTVFTVMFSTALLGGLGVTIIGGIVTRSFLGAIVTGLAWCVIGMTVAGIVLIFTGLTRHRGTRS